MITITNTEWNYDLFYSFSKRFSLIVPISGGVVIAVNDYVRFNYYLVMVYIFISMYIILINFKILSTTLHHRPVYFEDLVDDTQLIPGERVLYQKYFVQIIQPLLAVFLSILGAWLIYRVKNSQLSPFELVRILGGTLSWCC